MEIKMETAWGKLLIYGRRRATYSSLKKGLGHYPDLLAAARRIRYDEIDFNDPICVETSRKLFAKFYKNPIFLWH